MTSVANAALPHPLAVFGRSAARAVIAPVPRRPTVREAGVDRDDEVAPGIDIDAFRRGDSDTFRTVLQHFGPLIQVIAAAHTGNTHDREELYQEITVRLWQRRAQYSARGPLGGWINRIAHRFCFDWTRARATREAAAERHATEVLALDDAGTVLEDPSRLMDRTEFMDSLRLALAQLPQKQEHTFTLIHVRGYSIPETARMLKIRRATVRSNLRHATHKLRDLMEEYRA